MGDWFPRHGRCPCGSRSQFVACCGPKGVVEAELRTSVLDAMTNSGIAPRLIYGYERTGLIVTGQHRTVLSAAELDEWDDALAEFDETHN